MGKGKDKKGDEYNDNNKAYQCSVRYGPVHGIYVYIRREGEACEMIV